MVLILVGTVSMVCVDLHISLIICLARNGILRTHNEMHCI